MEKPQNSELFAGKRIFAPMVRAGRTPLRTLSLNYGADLVYTEEIVDQKLLEAQRIENVHLGTVDFIKGDELVLRIAAEEKSKCILQIGTASAENAAKICQKFGTEVAGIDLNMGCPKPFSVHAGMGAALLSEPLKAKEILTAMVSASPIPVSCKIRVLDDRDKTMEFVRMVEQCGVSAIAIHGRRRAERPSDECRVEEIRQICDAFKNIPIIANGGSQQIKSHKDIEEFRLNTGASSVMIARKAFTNPSIFRTEGGILPMDEEIVNYLKKACQYDEQFTGVKYVVQRMLGSQQQFDPRGRATVIAGTMRQICRIWGVEPTYLEWRRKLNGIEEEREEGNGPVKRPRIENDDGQMDEQKLHQNGRISFTLVDGIFTTDLSFPMKNLKNGLHGLPTPKCVLHKYCREQRWPAPIYEATQRPRDSRFTAKVSINSKQFSSTISQPNTRMAEQVAALVALHGLGIRHRLEGEWEESE